MEITLNPRHIDWFVCITEYFKVFITYTVYRCDSFYVVVQTFGVHKDKDQCDIVSITMFCNMSMAHVMAQENYIWTTN